MRPIGISWLESFVGCVAVQSGASYLSFYMVLSDETEYIYRPVYNRTLLYSPGFSFDSSEVRCPRKLKEFAEQCLA